jgi:hypothetical protein
LFIVLFESSKLVPRFAAASFFLRWLEKSEGEKRYSGKREIAPKKFDFGEMLRLK